MSQSAGKEEYLTSRALNRATSKGFKEASENAMEVAGFVVVAKDGWIVRMHKDGHTQKIKKIPQVSSRKLVLD